MFLTHRQKALFKHQRRCVKQVIQRNVVLSQLNNLETRTIQKFEIRNSNNTEIRNSNNTEIRNSNKRFVKDEIKANSGKNSDQ